MDFLYNIELEAVNSYELRDMNKKKTFPKNSKLKNISKRFYEDFGHDLLWSLIIQKKFTTFILTDSNKLLDK